MCFVLTLSACATKPPQSDESWRLIGKLSVRSESENLILGIDWRHTTDGNEIVLNGPLGLKVSQRYRRKVTKYFLIWVTKATFLMNLKRLNFLKYPN